MGQITAYRCDFPDCGTIGFSWEGLVKKVRSDGIWTYWCPEHYPYERCSVCQKLLRPYQASAVDWPGTVAKQKSNPLMCGTCAYRGYDVVETKPSGGPEVDAVRRLVVNFYKEREADHWLEPAEEVMGLLGID